MSYGRSTDLLDILIFFLQKKLKIKIQLYIRQEVIILLSGQNCPNVIVLDFTIPTVSITNGQICPGCL